MNIKQRIQQYLNLPKDIANLKINLDKINQQLNVLENQNTSYANELYDIQSKVSYYDDYDLEVMHSESHSNMNEISGLQYKLDDVNESIETMKIIVDSISSVYRNDNTLETCVKNEIEKYTVVVASSLQRRE